MSTPWRDFFYRPSRREVCARRVREACMGREWCRASPASMIASKKNIGKHDVYFNALALRRRADGASATRRACPTQAERG
jgi:hypothetical protein